MRLAEEGFCRNGMGGSRFSVPEREVGKGGSERIVDVKTRTISACYAKCCVLSCCDTRLYSDLAWRVGCDMKDNVTDSRRGEI